MSHSFSHSHLSILRRSTLRPVRAPNSHPRPFWCDVIDTPWSQTMRTHIVAAALVSGPGVPRTWRFYSQTQFDS